MSNRSSAIEVVRTYESTTSGAVVRDRRSSTTSRARLREVAPLSPAPRAVLFDLDGTLIDTMQVFADVAADVMVRHHALDRVHARAQYLATSGIPFFQQLEKIVPGHAANEEAAAEFERRKVVAVADVVPSEPTLETLAALRALGISVAVCSNNFQDQVDVFAQHCATSCNIKLDLALGFGNGLAKGATQFDHAARAFGCRRDDMLFVGDSIADAQLARAAGLRFVAKLGTFDAGSFVGAMASPVTSISEIPELLSLFAR